MSEKILVTSALPYVNNIPHLGNLIGAVLSADAYARHKRACGADVLYVCGADEHGSATEKKAREEGLSEEELCNKYEQEHKKIYDLFNISFDVWGRTHTKTHETIVQELYLKLKKHGYIYQETTTQLYDKEVQTFLADRFVEGECPHCGASGARGDQCDSCGQLLNALDLKNPISQLSGSTPITKETTHAYLDLPKLKPLLEEWMDTTHWSNNAKQTTKEWLANIEGRAISRDLKWGVPVPDMEGKVFYVWFDAPIGYISITADAQKNWEEYWKTPGELTQFMGKDNTIFHSIILPAILLGSGEDYRLVNKLSVTEYLQLKGAKFSKSKKTGVFGSDVADIQEKYNIPVDAFRYTLLAHRPETSDSEFSFETLHNSVNNELLANLGNLVHRTTHFAVAKELKREGDVTIEQHLLAREKYSTLAREAYEKCHIREAISASMKLAKDANATFQHIEPWKDAQAHQANIYALLDTISDLSILLQPIIPTLCEKIQHQLGIEENTYSTLGTKREYNLHQPTPLVEKIEDETVRKLTAHYMTSNKLNIQVAHIKTVENHPNADKLYKLTISLGDETRQVIAGLKSSYTPEELTGKTVLALTNLKKAVIRGEESQAMLLACESGEEISLLYTNSEVGGVIHNCEEEITFEEFLKHKITITKQELCVNNKQLCTVKTRNTINGPVR